MSNRKKYFFIFLMVLIFLLIFLALVALINYNNLPAEYTKEHTHIKFYFNRKPFIYLQRREPVEFDSGWGFYPDENDRKKTKSLAYDVIFDGFKITKINPLTITYEHENYESKYSTCFFVYDKEFFGLDNLKIVYRKGKYWYKIKMNNPQIGCQLIGYIYKNAQDSSEWDYSELKVNYFDYDCDNPEVYNIIGDHVIKEYSPGYGKARLIGDPSNQDKCKYFKAKDKNDISICETIGNQTLKYLCQGYKVDDFKDNDDDGLYNREETELYKTDMNNPDSDYDGHGDAQELLFGSDPNFNDRRGSYIVYDKMVYNDPEFKFKIKLSDIWTDYEVEKSDNNPINNLSAKFDKLYTPRINFISKNYLGRSSEKLIFQIIINEKLSKDDLENYVLESANVINFRFYVKNGIGGCNSNFFWDYSEEVPSINCEEILKYYPDIRNELIKMVKSFELI